MAEIPDAAVEAFDKAYEAATEYHAPDEMHDGHPLGIRAALAAAWPILAAQALRDAADANPPFGARYWLRRRADEIERGTQGGGGT